MVEFVSWIGVVVIAIFAAVGFTGLVATIVLAVVRALRRTAPAKPVEVHGRVAA